MDARGAGGGIRGERRTPSSHGAGTGAEAGPGGGGGRDATLSAAAAGRAAGRRGPGPRGGARGGPGPQAARSSPGADARPTGGAFLGGGPLPSGRGGAARVYCRKPPARGLPGSPAPSRADWQARPRGRGSARAQCGSLGRSAGARAPRREGPEPLRLRGPWTPVAVWSRPRSRSRSPAPAVGSSEVQLGSPPDLCAPFPLML